MTSKRFSAQRAKERIKEAASRQDARNAAFNEYVYDSFEQRIMKGSTAKRVKRERAFMESQTVKNQASITDSQRKSSRKMRSLARRQK